MAGSCRRVSGIESVSSLRSTARGILLFIKAMICDDVAVHCGCSPRASLASFLVGFTSPRAAALVCCVSRRDVRPGGVCWYPCPSPSLFRPRFRDRPPRLPRDRCRCEPLSFVSRASFSSLLDSPSLPLLSELPSLELDEDESPLERLRLLARFVPRLSRVTLDGSAGGSLHAFADLSFCLPWAGSSALITLRGGRLDRDSPFPSPTWCDVLDLTAVPTAGGLEMRPCSAGRVSTARMSHSSSTKLWNFLFSFARTLFSH